MDVYNDWLKIYGLNFKAVYQSVWAIVAACFFHLLWDLEGLPANQSCALSLLVSYINNRHIGHDEVYVGMTLVSQAMSSGLASTMWVVQKDPGFLDQNALFQAQWCHIDLGKRASSDCQWCLAPASGSGLHGDGRGLEPTRCFACQWILLGKSRPRLCSR